MNFLLIFPIVDFFFSSVDLNVVCCDPVLDEVVPVVKQREKMKKEEEIYDEFLICHQQYTHRSRKERRKKKKVQNSKIVPALLILSHCRQALHVQQTFDCQLQSKI